MEAERLRSAVAEGEDLRYVDELRTGGAVGLTDQRLLVVRADEESTSVDLTAIESVEFQDLDWFNAVLGIALVGFGLVSLGRNMAMAGLFAAAGVVSLYLTYRKRELAQVKVHARPKPVKLYPADGREFYEAFDEALSDYREQLSG